jgi:hypothetical protein
MASNKNRHEFNKNLETMIDVINAQIPKKNVGAMVSTKMRLIFPQKMGIINLLAHQVPLDIQEN